MIVIRHKLPCLSPKKELAERQISSHQKHYGQAYTPILNFFSVTPLIPSTSSLASNLSGVGVAMLEEMLSYCTTWPRTLNQQHPPQGVDWELIRQTCSEFRVLSDLLDVLREMCLYSGYIELMKYIYR